MREVTDRSMPWHGLGIGCAAIFVILFASFVSAVSSHSLGLLGEAMAALGVATFGYLTAICAVKSQRPE
jgi:hypothetical protein